MPLFSSAKILVSISRGCYNFCQFCMCYNFLLSQKKKKKLVSIEYLIYFKMLSKKHLSDCEKKGKNEMKS